MKVKGIIISVFLSLIALLIMPFSVSADSLSTTLTTSNIIGYNLKTNADYESSVTTVYTNYITVVFDDSYICGNISYTMTYKQVNGTNTITKSGMAALNGSSFTISTETTNYRVDEKSITMTSLTYTGNCYRISDGLNFPIESFFAINYILSEYPISGLRDDFHYPYTFPVFEISGPNGWATRCQNTSADDMGIFVFLCNQNLYMNTFENYFYLNPSNCVLDSVEHIQPIGSGWSIYKVKYYNPTGGDAYIRVKSTVRLAPIYSNLESYHMLSTDFALTYGLRNEFIDYMEQIAENTNGNTSSDSSADDLEDVMSDFTSSSNDVINVENNIGSGFENSLQDIPTSFNFSNQFGASFIRSAQWVRDQFNAMTLNNPFGSLITFSLILGVGLLLLGRKLL